MSNLGCALYMTGVLLCGHLPIDWSKVKGYQP